MARPQHKTELIVAAHDTFDQLWSLIASLTREEFETPLDFSTDSNLKEAHWSRDKNIRDILIHLYEWHQLFLNWAQSNLDGKKTKFLPEPYTFQTTAALNKSFWLQHQQTSFDEAVTLLKQSYDEVMALIDTFTDKALFTKQYYFWTGTTSLGSYCVSATSSHYHWAIKKIKKHRKNVAKNVCIDF